jgi:hypothetical protein
MKQVSYLVIAMFLLILILPTASASQFSENTSTLSSGGGNASSASYSSEMILSQAAAGNSSSSSYDAGTGFIYTLNNAPECSGIPNQSWNQNTAIDINLSAYSSDIDNDDLSYSSENPANIAVSISGPIATLVPDPGFSGARSIIFYASDYSEQAACNNITLTIIPAPPTPSSGGRAAIAIENFTISREAIRATVKQGGVIRETIILRNTGNTKLSFTIDISRVKGFTMADQASFALNAGEAKAVNFDFFASENQKSGVYTGQIFIYGGGITKTINTIFEVLPKIALFDIKTAIPEKYKKVPAGKDVEANITMINMGDLRNIDAELEISITNLCGEIIELRHETLAIPDAKINILRTMKVPESAPPGDYILNARINYNGSLQASASDFFSVAAPLPAPIIKIDLLYLAIAITLAIITILIILMLAKGRKTKKKEIKEYIAQGHSALNKKMIDGAKEFYRMARKAYYENESSLSEEERKRLSQKIIDLYNSITSAKTA